MSDNDFALQSYRETGDVRSLEAHARAATFDDDAGWEIARMLESPGFRECQCGSGLHWQRCNPTYTGYCG